MTALLTAHLPLLAGAPNGIKKLRELILELAVRGKLVPQNSNDKPMEPLLNASRIARAKAMAEGKIKKEKAAAEIVFEEQSFKLPNGWAWCRVVDTGDYINGLAFKPSDWSGSGRPIIRIQNLSGRNSEFNRTDREVDASVVVNEGDILVSWSATLEAYVWSGEQGVLNQHIFRVSPSELVFDQYLFWLLKWTIRVLANSDHAHGLVMAHINRGPFLAQAVGLPPLEEQERIVAKVVELMALCDRLEAQQADTESAHTRLVQALLESLTQASDATDFADSWQRLSEHFHTLFTTESSIDILKQTLLQLAVVGKLVPQDSSDEPVSKLLVRLNKERERLEVEGLCKKVKALDPLHEDEKPCKLPASWEWVRLGTICSKVTDGEHATPRRSSSGHYLLSARNVTNEGILLGDVDFVPPDEFERIRKRCDPNIGDVLISCSGSVGRVALVDRDNAYVMVRSAAMVRPISIGLSPEFIAQCLRSPIMQAEMVSKSRKSAQANLFLGAISSLVIPVAPQAEQHRIVAKVNQLMALCDRLKARLTQARQLNEQLASTLVEQAVA
ncbi:restriction endonuclease [Pseudomonas frederiksbergensis]|uniref:restriction endonuclease subunit S n=1 Tax=Pseudomonas frederiksbergensis TaxID=104087 RepID=UPI0009587C84|nr:restriction endonuclease subunit S [Pseudomonas frederiksbergensis]APV39859.1 restriction endonuclease [Pseudomonas frederiksbergensis]